MVKKGVVGVALLLLSFVASALDLKSAEALALQRANELRQFELQSDALQASATAAGQLPDPSVHLGALNFPVDTFKLSQEPMTQIQAGVTQAFPKGSSLKYQYLSLQEQVQAKRYQRNLEVLIILKKVREAWFELAAWQQSERILLTQYRTFKHLKEVAASLYANNKVGQKDVLNAQLELSQIQERLVKSRQAIQTTRAQLARWIGDTAASKTGRGQLNRVVSFKRLKKNLVNHPSLNIDKANIAAAKAEVELVRQDFKPGFSAGVAYGYRQGQNIDGSKRPDFLTGNVSVSLPLFPKNRQHKKLVAATKRLSAQQEQYQLDYKEMIKLFDISRADAQKNRQRLQLYRSTLLPQAKQYAESTLVAYQNNQTDFINVAQSHIRRLDLQLAEIQQALALHKTTINLLFLQGHLNEK